MTGGASIWSMWARLFDIALGAWLIASAFVVPGAGWLEIASGVIVIVLAVVAMIRPKSRAHLAELIVATVLVIVGWLGTRGGGEDPVHAQNLIITGLMIMVFAICPTRGADPPPAWRADEGRA